MRKLMWFAVGFAGACGVGIYLVSGLWLLLLGVFSLAALGALLCVRSLTARKMVCVLFGWIVGIVWLWCFSQWYLAPVHRMDGQGIILSIEVTDYSRASPYGITAEGKTEVNGKPYSVQFYINENCTLSPGDRVEGVFRLRYTGGGTENPTYHKGEGIFLLCYPKGEYAVIPRATLSAMQFAPVLRQKILTLLEQLFPADTAPFAKALLLGDTQDLGFGIRSAMKTAGVYHVVAVSGMHVAILFALVYILCGKHRVLTAVFGIPILFLFAAVAGFSPSIVRACIMQVIMILAMLVNKEYDPPTALSAAVLILLASNPLCITSISFQLSVGCMVGIFLFSKPIHDYFLNKPPLGPAKGKSVKARLIRWAVGSVSVTLGAMSVTVPLCAVYFGSVSLAGIVANLMIMWLISFVFYGIMAACVTGAVWFPAGTVIGVAVSLPIRFILKVVDMISRIPLSAVYTSSIYIVAWLIFCYVLLAVFLKNKKKHPGILTCCIAAGLLGAVVCGWLEPRLDNYRITAVDVGQGQCLLLQTDGKYYMVDCGGDSDEKAADEATKLLLSQGIFRLDGLILTHYDADHAGGVDELLSRIPADRIYAPVYTGENELKDALVSEFQDKIQWVEADTYLENADITIYPSAETEDTNESSLCVLFQPENCDALITGDRSESGELALMEHTDLPDLEILVVGHHGSRTSTSWELLNKTRPEIAIISVGADNRYGHPTEETLERLGLFGCKVYRTDTEGTVIFRGRKHGEE